MQKKISTGISFDKEVLIRIDNERGDISRSKYILRKLEQVYRSDINNNSFSSHGSDYDELKWHMKSEKGVQ